MNHYSHRKLITYFRTVRMASFQDKWAAPQESEWLYRLVSEWRNYTSGYYEPSPFAPRDFKMLDGSHFTTYIGKDMGYT